MGKQKLLKHNKILFYFYNLVQHHDVDNAHRLFSTIVNKTNPIYLVMFKGKSLFVSPIY